MLSEREGSADAALGFQKEHPESPHLRRKGLEGHRLRCVAADQSLGVALCEQGLAVRVQDRSCLSSLSPFLLTLTPLLLSLVPRVTTLNPMRQDGAQEAGGKPFCFYNKNEYISNIYCLEQAKEKAATHPLNRVCSGILLASLYKPADGIGDAGQQKQRQKYEGDSQEEDCDAYSRDDIAFCVASHRLDSFHAENDASCKAGDCAQEPEAPIRYQERHILPSQVVNFPIAL